MFKDFFSSRFKETMQWKYINTFFKMMPQKVLTAIILMVVISFTEGIGLVLLIPLLQLVGIDVQQGSIGQISAYVNSIFAAFNIQPTLVIVLGIYVLVISVTAILYRWETIISLEVQTDFISKLRKKLYSSITNSNWLFFSSNRSSDFSHLLTDEIDRVGVGISQLLLMVADIMVTVVYVIFALELSGIITGLVFLVGAFLIILLNKKTESAHLIGQEISDATKKLYASTLQHLDGMKTIKSYGMQKRSYHDFSKIADEVADKQVKSITVFADTKLIFDIASAIVLCVIIVILVQILAIPAAVLLILLYLFARLTPKFSNIQHNYQYFINTMPSFANYLQILKKSEAAAESKQDQMENQSNEIEFTRSIKFENVSFSYDSNKPVFKDLNLQIPSGKTVALVGPSGAGKSTIADLLIGLVVPTEGNIYIDSTVLDASNILQWRDQISYVAQDTFLFNDSIKENLLLSNPTASEEEIWGALKAAAADKFVARLEDDIDTVVGDRGVRLSGGERQRLSLARALLRNPSVLILDEATSNVDVENEKKILEAIEKLHGDVTILLIAHRLSTIKNADVIYSIEKGKLLDLDV